MARRVLVVDDDREIVRLLRAYLEQAGFEVLVAYDGERALHAIRRDRPELVVLDLMLPGMDGWDVTRVVRSDPAIAPTPIVMLTARVEDADKVVGLELGADAYVTKPFNPRVVVAHVRAILRRAEGDLAAHKVLACRDVRVDVDRHMVTVGGEIVSLTSTEFAFLRALMEQPGHAFTRSELVETSLGSEYDGLERTVDTHIKNLRRKIEPDGGGSSLIETVYGVGYRLWSEL